MDILEAKEIIEDLIDGNKERLSTSIHIYDKECTALHVVLSELEKKEAIINEMAKHIHLSGDYECLNKECEDDESKDCEECIKEYFTNKVEKEGIKE